MVMAPSVSLFCTYGKYSAVVKACSSFRYEDLVNFLCEKWSKLTPKSFFFSYGLPGCPKLMLDNDEDLEVMLSNIFPTSIDRVDVYVTKTRFLYADEEGEDKALVLKGKRRAEIETEDLAVMCMHEKKHLLTEKWQHLIKGVDQCFAGGTDQFRDALRKYSIERGFHYKYLKNEGLRVTVECLHKVAKKCEWFIHGRLDKKSGNFYIRQFVENHSCGAAVRTSNHERLSSSLVATCIRDLVNDDPLISAVDVRAHFKHEYGLDMTYHHAWNGVEKAKDAMFGNHACSFNLLRWYVEEVRETNPGSHVDLQYDLKTGRFQKMFLAFAGCIHGFQYCLPLIFLDGTFIKSRYRGALLSVFN